MLNPHTLQPGQEQHEYYKSRATRRRLCQYDYRDMDGKLFSCVMPTLADCRKSRDQWNTTRKENQP